MKPETVETMDASFDQFFGIDLSGPEWDDIKAHYAVSRQTHKIVKFADEYEQLTAMNRIQPELIIWMEHECFYGIHHC